eukprot:465779_1
MSDSDDGYFCSTSSETLYSVYTIYVLLAVFVLPFAVYCLVNHCRHHQTTNIPKSLHRSTIVVYACTITGLTSSILQVTDCMDVSTHIKNSVWYFKSVSWILQTTIFLQLLFSRVHRVFDGSAYKLSKCTTLTFKTLYVLLVVCIIGALFGMVAYYMFEINGVWILYAACYALGLLLTITLGTYLPVLLITKLILVNNTMQMMQQMEISIPSTSSTHNISTITNKDTQLLRVVRKCAILSSISLISLFSVFMCVIIATVSGSSNVLLITWGGSIIIDMDTTFLCVMLSNRLYNTQYMIICGWLDNCFRRNCCHFKHNQVMMDLPETKQFSSKSELSSKSSIGVET